MLGSKKPDEIIMTLYICLYVYIYIYIYIYIYVYTRTCTAVNSHAHAFTYIAYIMLEHSEVVLGSKKPDEVTTLF